MGSAFPCRPTPSDRIVTLARSRIGRYQSVVKFFNATSRPASHHFQARRFNASFGEELLPFRRPRCVTIFHHGSACSNSCMRCLKAAAVTVASLKASRAP